MKFVMKRLICYILLFSLTTLVHAQQKVTIEAASPDPTLTVRGPEKDVQFVNLPSWEKVDNALTLFSNDYGNKLQSEHTDYTALQIDKNMRVTAIINGGVGKNTRPSFTQKLALTIPHEGFVLLASDKDYASAGCRKFVAENFKVGDVVKLRIDGEISSLKQVIALKNGKALPSIRLDSDHIQTVKGTSAKIEGMISSFDKQDGYELFLRQDDSSTPLRIHKHGAFSASLDLRPGVNYYDLLLMKEGVEVGKQPLIVYAKGETEISKERVMWVEQFPNAKVLVCREAVAAMVQNVKAADFTAIGLDVKGPEGYVSYRKNDLSHCPYFTETSNPNKKVKDTGFDLLQVVLEEAHAIGLKVYASFNFFAEGNVTTQDYAVLKQHKDWEEIVQRPEDKGKLLKITESTRGKEAADGKLVALAFVNPSNKEVQDYQLLRVEEVLKNYDVDGIVLDRCRYDNLYADFSHVSRNAFEDYLAAQGKQLENFPADAFHINKSGVMVKGKHFKEWITFRSQTISDFAKRIRKLVDLYKCKKNPNLKMAAYVGSWYEVYYQNGVNWASHSFQYDSRLGFPDSEIYDEAYYQTSYLKYLDFLMIGTYYKTAKEVNRYITLGNILTCGECPILGSLSLPDLKKQALGTVMGTALKNSAGLMIFDYCYVDWPTFVEQARKAYAIMKK